MTHATDDELFKRLRRAEGHLATVVRMVSDGADGLATAQQLQAVIKALEKAKKALILDYIDHHLIEITGPLPDDLQAKLSDFREITKYL